MNQEIDNKLLISVINGDHKSIKVFFDSCQQIIWGALKTFDQIPYEDKQDLVSDIIQKKILGLEGKYEPLRKFRGDSKFSSYLYQIVTYTTLSFLKSKGMKYRPKTSSIDDAYNLFSKTTDINDDLTLEYCLSKLKDKEKVIMDLVGQGYKQREIADKFNQKPNTIAAIISRANRKLKKCMQDN